MKWHYRPEDGWTPETLPKQKDKCNDIVFQENRGGYYIGWMNAHQCHDKKMVFFFVDTTLDAFDHITNVDDWVWPIHVIRWSYLDEPEESKC